ncbi:hypothetical protein IFM89_028419 [Coptis chinensis]|uniref:Peptidase M48 domain-containing protein n=1 Tax=Coptis chinensis TaxID=261450 RepID=A0A835IQC7_9MAGN|nr:hypothetical protein IFM89_028419 [Coptis chinensis]
MSWYMRAMLGITSFHNLTSTTQLYGKTIIPTCKPTTSSFQRYYNVERNQDYIKFKKTKRWVIYATLGSGIVVSTLCYHGIENVPFTNRRHFVICSPMTEKLVGDLELEDHKLKYKGKLLDEKHPQSMRAKLILKNIIQGLEREVKRNPNSNASGFIHYDEFNWNILVVDTLWIQAFYIAGGNIFICRGALEAFTDGELAMFIGHEVGHVVARHLAEFPKIVSRSS